MQVPGLVFGGAIYRSFFGGGRYEFGVGFGRLCSKKKHIILLAVLIFMLLSENYALCHRNYTT